MPLGELHTYLHAAFARPPGENDAGNDDEMTELWHAVLAAAGAW